MDPRAARLRELAEFIDALSTEKQHFWLLPRRALAGEVELHWQRVGGLGQWRLRLVKEAVWLNLLPSNMHATCDGLGVDLAALEREVAASILSQAVFADTVLKAATSLFSPQTVARAVADHGAFIKELGAVVAQMVSTPQPPPPARLTLVTSTKVKVK